MAYYTKEVMSITKSNTTLMIISALTVSLFLAAIGTAQMSSAQTNKTAQGNQTTATVAGKANATIVNKTTVPAEQTTVTVNQTSKSVGQGGVKPLENQTVKQAQQQPAANISSVKNQTMVKPAGKATTTIVNKTNVPFNQTTVTTGNETTTPTSPASQANQSAQSQGNQSTSQNKPAGDVLGQLGKGLQNLNPFKK
jgi:hypothetical protein